MNSEGLIYMSLCTVGRNAETLELREGFILAHNESMSSSRHRCMTHSNIYCITVDSKTGPKLF